MPLSIMLSTEQNLICDDIVYSLMSEKAKSSLFNEQLNTSKTFLFKKPTHWGVGVGEKAYTLNRKSLYFIPFYIFFLVFMRLFIKYICLYQPQVHIQITTDF